MTIKPLTITSPMSSFEIQPCQLVVGNKRFILLNIYRPPSTSIEVFVDELSAVIDECTQMNGRLLLLGDYNCPGVTSTSIDERLLNVPSEFGLSTVNKQST